MKILFMGTPDFARSILEALLGAGENVAAVVTQPDKPKGRKMLLTPPPVKECALAHGIPVWQPATLKDGAFLAEINEIAPDVILVAAYGKILPAYVLDYPKYGCINAHASLLPRHRGAAPIQRAILEGDAVTGVTAMYMAAGLDTGDMILKEEVTIAPEDDFGTLHDKLAEAGGRAMLETLARLRAGTITREAQSDADATYAAKIGNEDCLLDFARPVREVHDRVRALSPFPLAFCTMPDGRALKLIRACAIPGAVSAAPGTVVACAGTVDIACADGVLRVTEVQPEGKRRMDAAAFLNGRGIAVGDVLTTPVL